MSYQQKQLSVCILGALLLSLAFSTSAIGMTFTVDSTVDEEDSNPGDGICSALGSGLCTIRAAIQETNILPSDDTIILGEQTYLLTRHGSDEDAAVTGDLDITGGGDLVIQGSSMTTSIIDANRAVNQDRIFHIHSTAGKVTLKDFTAKNAKLVYGNGAGIFNAGPNTIIQNVEISDNYAVAKSIGPFLSPTAHEYGVGGGIFNDINASLIVDSSNVIFNYASNKLYFDSASKIQSGGGGIRNLGYLEVINGSEINRNWGDTGAGICNTGVAYISDSIIMQNRINKILPGPPGWGGSGGGIANIGGILSVSRSYVGDNKADGGDGGGISNMSAPTECPTCTPDITNTDYQSIAIIIGSAIDNNQAILGMGAGISNMALMYVGNSSISWNGGSGVGVGVSNILFGDLTLENTTIVGNHRRASFRALGTGLYTSAAVKLDQVTLTGNFSRSLSPGEELFVATEPDQFDINNPRDWVTIKNSIIGDSDYTQKIFAYPAALNLINNRFYRGELCGGGYSLGPNGITDPTPQIDTNDYLNLIHSEGYNITDANNCGLNATGDSAIETAPNLLDAGAHGGPVLPPGPFLINPISRPPVVGSPAIDAIPMANCSTQFDQRLFGRTDGACDTGATEYGDVVVPYTDLELRITTEAGFNIRPEEPVQYRMRIKNLGPNTVGGLGGSALIINYTFDSMVLSDFTYTAPVGGGTVSCYKIADENRGVCYYSAPLLPNTELWIDLTLTAFGEGATRNITAEITDSSLPDPYLYNNKATINHKVSRLPYMRPPAPGLNNGPYGPQGDSAEVIGGAMSLIELYSLTLIAILLLLFRTSSVVRHARKWKANSVLFICYGAFSFTASHAAIPTITNITPNSGSSTTSTSITITGTGFDSGVKIGLINNPNVSTVVTRLTDITKPDLVQIQNNVLYVGKEGNNPISVYDVINPLNPILQTTIYPDIIRSPGGDTFSNSTVYYGFNVTPDNRLFVPITQAYDALVIHDFNTPSTPVLTNRFPVFTRKDGFHPNVSDGINDIEIDGNILYVLKGLHSPQPMTLYDQPGLYIIDTSITTRANILSFTPLNNYGLPKLKVVTVDSTKLVFVAGVPNEARQSNAAPSVDLNGVQTEGDLIIIDATDPVDPVVRFAVKGPTQASGYNRIWDVDVKLVPGIPTKVYAIAASRNTSNSSDGGLHVYDVGPDTNYAITSPIASYYTLGNFNRVEIDGDVATAVNVKTGSVIGFYDFDISDPTHPKLIGGPYTTGSDTEPTTLESFTPFPNKYVLNGGYIYGKGRIYQRNPAITVTTVTATTITATIAADFIPQTYGLVVTNSVGEEAILLNAFSVTP